mgnify:FL=1
MIRNKTPSPSWVPRKNITTRKVNFFSLYYSRLVFHFLFSPPTPKEPLRSCLHQVSSDQAKSNSSSDQWKLAKTVRSANHTISGNKAEKRGKLGASVHWLVAIMWLLFYFITILAIFILLASPSSGTDTTKAKANYCRSVINPSPSRKRWRPSTTPGTPCPTLFEQYVGSFISREAVNTEEFYETGPMPYFPYQRRLESNHSQMYLLRQHFLLSYLKTPSVGRVRTRPGPRPPARWSDTRLTEPNGRWQIANSKTNIS